MRRFEPKRNPEVPRYHLRKKEQEITDPARKRRILKKGKYATLALCRGHEPYAVTLNYGYDEQRNRLYFHSALEGLKLDFLSHNPNVCATIIEDLGYMQGQCDHRYRSLVMWGTISMVDDPDEKQHGMHILLEHLERHPEEIEKRALSNQDIYQKVAILRMDITQICGKEHL